MELLFEIWFRLFEHYAEDVILQDGGIVSFLVIGVLAYLVRTDLGRKKKCECCLYREQEWKERERENATETEQ